MLAPETLLQNRYRIVRLLGQGGMGAVYEAMDERLDTAVALKETLFADERLRKQFEREARLLARMHHPALPRVSDHFSEGEGQFLVMQYIAGDDLAEMIKSKQGPFAPDQVLAWGDQLLDALDYLHTQDPQIIHRDIKPQNLKLTSRGQIILLDFGLAKGQTGGVSLVTTSASIYGYTPNYAPLEQIQGLGTDARSDIYALSATLYHLMTSVKPPDALTRAAALVNGQPDPLARANEINESVGSEVSNILARAMRQNREQRFPTAAAMRAALREVGDDAPLEGKTEAATVLFNPSAATLADVTRPSAKQTLGRQTGSTPATRAARNPSDVTVEQPQIRGKRRLGPWAMAAAAVVLIGVLFGGFYAYQRASSSTAGEDHGTGNPIVAEPAANSTTSTEPLAGSLKEEKKSDVSNQRVEETEAAKINDKAVKNRDKIAEKASNAVRAPVPNPPRVVERSPIRENTPAESLPQINEPDLSRLGPRRRRMGGVAVRNFPDGTQLITSRDGTRVVILPDGTRRVFRPGERIDRRRRLP